MFRVLQCAKRPGGECERNECGMLTFSLAPDPDFTASPLKIVATRKAQTINLYNINICAHVGQMYQVCHLATVEQELQHER